MQLTDSKLLANQANSQKSTGPKTPDGKKRSSLRALRHGLTGRVIVMPDEDYHAYEAFSKRWSDDLNPHGVIEQGLVQQMTDCQWVLNRAQSLIESLEAIGHNFYIQKIDTSHPEADNAIAAGMTFKDYSHELEKLSRYLSRVESNV